MDDLLQALRADRRVAQAESRIGQTNERVLADQAELTAIPAPPFDEARRAVEMSVRLRDAGVRDVETDGVGNAVGYLPGTVPAAPVVLSAHLDTVFPADTSTEVRRSGDLLTGPGISDDGRGLAVLLGVARAMTEAGLRPRAPLLFAATVGEEGAGNLRGATYLLGPNGNGRHAAAFISVDGAGLDRIVTRGLGSLRFRVTARGPGGHSWIDWGTVNPIHALASLVERLTTAHLPTDPPTSLTVARWQGGTAINAIPQEAWVEIDTRSESSEELRGIEATLRATAAAVAEAHTESGAGGLTMKVDVIGNRPAGFTPPDAPVVTSAVSATRAAGGHPSLVTSSTDANAAMAVGIPAVTIGGGGEAGLAHSTGEWYRDVGGERGVLRAFLTALLLTGMVD